MNLFNNINKMLIFSRKIMQSIQQIYMIKILLKIENKFSKFLR